MGSYDTIACHNIFGHITANTAQSYNSDINSHLFPTRHITHFLLLGNPNIEGYISVHDHQ